MFRDTADDEAGLEARTTIVEFVTDRMPAIELPNRETHESRTTYQ